MSSRLFHLLRRIFRQSAPPQQPELAAERKNAEMKVQESEQLFRALVENSPDFIARYDLECRRIYVNPAIQKLFPTPHENVLGETPEQQSPIKTPQLYIEHLQKVIKTGDESFLETPFRTAQGEMHWGQIRFTPEFDPNGKVSSVMAIGRDIHEIKESEQRSSRFIANLPAFFFTFRRTEDGRYCFPYASTGIKTLYGLNPEDVREDMTPLHLLAHPDDRPRIEADLAEAFETLAPFRLEYRVCPPNMPQRWLETRSIANREADGSILWYGIMLDITERKQAEEAQQQLNRELRAISTCSQAVIRAEDEQMLLNDVCNTICDDTGYVLAWVGYAEQDAEKSIRPMAWAGNDSGYIANAKLSWSEDLPHGQGPAGIAIRSGKAYYVQDFSEDEHMFPWRSAALQRGYHSGIALPLKDENAAVFGVLLIYSTEINAITPDELRLMEELADDLAFGIVALRTRAERKQAEQQLILQNFALNNISEEALLVDEQAHISYVNDAACRGLKYSRDELLTMTIPDIDPLFSLEKWPETWTNIRERGSLTFEGLHRASDHSEYPVEVSASYFDYENRGYILALSRDITKRKHTEQEMLRINRFLRTLSRCNETLVHAQDEQSLLQDMCRAVVEVGEFVLAWVGFSDDSHTLRIQSQFGGVVEGFVDSDTLIDGTVADQRCRPAIRALQSGKIEVVQNSATDPCLPWRTQALEFGYNSAIALPLLNGDRVFGVLGIYSSETESFGSEETALLSELASDLSYGIHALRTRIDREHYVNQLKDSMESTIQALASTLDLRDPYTAGHQRRVANLAAAIARAAGFAEDRVQVTSLAGLIHDIGKIAIPAEILSKPGRLSETEMALARLHVTASYDILKNIDFPWPIARIVRQHHERMDGSGYPDGLKGNEILQEARILMVADVVEAMNTHRPYRPAMGLDEALEELQKGRGTIYDADIVDLCIKLFREDGYVLE